MGIRLTTYFILLGLLALVPVLDLDRPNLLLENQLFTESSFVELTQLVLLAASLIAVSTLWRCPQYGPVGAFLGFLLAGAMVREMDFFLDRWFFDGAWQVLLSVLLGGTVVYLWPRRSVLWQRLGELPQTVGFGMMFSGFAVVMAFSRLFGRDSFWRQVMGSGYDRSVKNLAEESVELLGYAILTVGVVECVLALRAAAHREALCGQACSAS
ncbi:MAG: hypothetical protein AAF736_12120 [Pseudomonadota bacterium]